MVELAAASSVVGLISLGLQVCTGLIEYHGARKDYNKDCKDITRHLDNLTNALEVLQTVLNSSDLAQRPSFKVVEDNILACAEGIGELQVAQKRCFSNTSSKASRQLNRTLYPFRKSEIIELKATLMNLQANLNLAMQAAEWYVSNAEPALIWALNIHHSDQGDYMLSVLRSQHEQGMGQLSTISVQIRDESTASNSVILQRLEDLTELVNQKFDDLHINGQRSPTTSGTWPAAQHRQCDFPSPVNARRCDKTHSKSRDNASSRALARSQSACTCKRKESFFSETTWDYNVVQFRSQAWGEHHPSCPEYRSTKKLRKNEVRIVLPFMRYASGKAVPLEITIGIGGTSLWRALACRRVLEDSHPVFELLKCTWRMDRVSPEFLSHKRKSLNEMFFNGEVCPNDVKSNGETIFHVSVTVFDINLVLEYH